METKEDFIQEIVKLESIIADYGSTLQKVKEAMIAVHCEYKRKDNITYNHNGKIRFGTIEIVNVNRVMQFYVIVRPKNNNFENFNRRLDCHKVLISEIIKRYE